MTFISKIAHQLNHRDTKLIPKISTKYKIGFVLTLIVLTTLITRSIFAQNYVIDKQKAFSKGNNQESWLNESLYSNLMSIQIMLSGTLPEKVLNGQVQLSDIPNYKPSGVFGGLMKVSPIAFNIPVSSTEYFAQIKDNFLGKPAYAQGYGFTSLGSSILPLWKIFRNVTYTLFSIIFIVIGIMIMLRVKISPQAVLTIENSIPKIIMTLILITFSYAIAGLMIDFMYLIIGLFVSLLFNGGLELQEGGAILKPQWVWQEIINFAGLSPFTQERLTSMNFHSFTELVKRITPGTLSLTYIVFNLTTFMGVFGVIASFFSIGASVFIGLIFSILTVICVLKFIFGLFKNYLVILLHIIFAPIEIAMGAFPNSKLGFSTWATQLIGNIAVFPASFIFLLIVNLLMDYTWGNKGIWAPPLLDGSSIFIASMIGIAGLLLLPKLPTMIPEFIFMIKPSPWGKAIGEAASHNFITGTAGYVWSGTKQAGQTVASGYVKRKFGLDENIKEQQSTTTASANQEPKTEPESGSFNDGEGI